MTVVEAVTAMAGVTVVEAATVLCIRTSPVASGGRSLCGAVDYLDHRALSREATKRLGLDFELQFSSGIQVLMGQSEVVNWPRSSAQELVFMRYGGEFKFAGGSREQHESLEQTARRELGEEFMITVPADAVLRPFRVNSTKALGGKAFIMYNYVAIAEENPWLMQLDVGTANRDLHDRRKQFKPDAAFWEMSREEREMYSPEVYQLQWLDIADAVDMMLTSKCLSLVPVNNFQRDEFGKYGIQKRDPMFASMMTLQLVEDCGSVQGVKEASREFDISVVEQAHEEAKKRRNETWLEGYAAKL